MTFGSLVAATVLAGLASGCGGSTTTAVSAITAPEALRCQAALSTTPSTVPHGGSRVTLTVRAERECAWTATSDATWAQVAPSAGQGEAPVTVTVAANPAGQARSATIAINDARLSLTQEAAPCRFQLDRTRDRMSHEGGRTAVALSVADGCAWRATTNAPTWARVVTGSGTGSGTVQIEVSPNAGSERTAAVTIADQTFTLVQEGRPQSAPAPSPAPPPAAPPPPPPPGSGGGGGGGGARGERIDLSGRALLVEGSCPNLSFVVDFRRVFTDRDTRFRGRCQRIRNGTDLSVEGRVQSDGRVRATEVRVHGDDEDDDEDDEDDEDDDDDRGR